MILNWDQLLVIGMAGLVYLAAPVYGRVTVGLPFWDRMRGMGEANWTLYARVASLAFATVAATTTKVGTVLALLAWTIGLARQA